MAKYIIASTAVTDEIRFADGNRVEQTAGGAGIYALCGIKLWTDDVLLVTGVGEDYKELYGSWYDKNQVSMDGLIVKDPRTPHTVIRYFPDGERVETPLYGDGHYSRMEVTPEELRPYFKTARGIYIFKNSNKDFWDSVLLYKKESSAAVMWEIANDAAYRENLDMVREIARQVDIFSINWQEARNLTGSDKPAAVILELKSWGLPLIYLRRGGQGAVMITSSEVGNVEAEKNVCVVDPTGGGNSSSGGVLYGFCEGYSPVQCGQMGSKSAAMCITQYGIPELITREVAYVK